MRSVTLADIAREAGTSRSTASRALNGRGYVSAPARKRLLAVADRLGYVPNASARTLKQKTSRVVGVIVTDLGNQFYARLAAGIEQTLREADYQMVLVADNSDGEQELRGIRTFLAMRAAGVIMTPANHAAGELLARHGVRIVEIDRRLVSVACDAVVIDNAGGAQEATAHLIELGHRRIGLLAADTDWTTDEGRVAGYRLAHAATRLPVDERLIVRVAFQAPDTERKIEALLDERPTAIFAANNSLAESAWNVLRARGLVLPRDISLVGFDDVAWMSMVEPRITAIAQPAVEMGRRAARLLLRAMGEDGDVEPRVERLEPRLVVRGSSGPPPASAK